MNFVDEVNSFERWLESHFLPPLSQLLWYKLFMLCNRSGWQEWVQVDNPRLMGLVGVRREQTFIEMRDKLVTAGIVDFERGKKGYPNRYRLISFTSINAFDLKVQSVANREVQTAAQTANIYKLDKTKSKNKEGVSASSGREEKKVFYGDFVSLTEKERDSLSERYGESGAAEMIEILDHYKGADPKRRKYASDYRAILSWVVKRWQEDRKKRSSSKEMGFAEQVALGIIRYDEKGRRRDDDTGSGSVIDIGKDDLSQY